MSKALALVCGVIFGLILTRLLTKWFRSEVAFLIAVGGTAAIVVIWSLLAG